MEKFKFTEGKFVVELLELYGQNNESAIFNVKRVDGTYGIGFTLYRWPTNNCQLASIATALLFFRTIGDKNTIHKILKKCYQHLHYTPNMLLLDVRAEGASEVEGCFGLPVTKTPYTSTNRSSMILYIFQCEWHKY